MVTYSCIMYISSNITRLHKIKVGGFMIKTIYWKVKVPQNPEHHQYVINSFLAHRHRDRLRLLQTLHDQGKKKWRHKIMASKIQQHKLYILYYSNINSLILCLDVKWLPKCFCLHVWMRPLQEFSVSAGSTFMAQRCSLISSNESPQACLESEQWHQISFRVSCGGNITVSPDKTFCVCECVCLFVCSHTCYIVRYRVQI